MTPTRFLSRVPTRPLGQRAPPQAIVFLRALLILLSLVTAAHAAESTTADLFTSFTKNGEDGLYLTRSADGFHDPSPSPPPGPRVHASGRRVESPTPPQVGADTGVDIEA